MKMMFLTVASVVLVLGAVTLAMTWAPQRKKEIVGITAEQVRWSAPPY